MTAILFLLEPERVCLAMDTRCLELKPGGDRANGPFCTKIFLLPHLRAAICGTGIRSLPFYWHAFVQQNVVAHDLTGLDHIAEAKLPGLAAECGVSKELTATIYHFGFSYDSGEFAGRAFRSTNGFAPEELQCPGLAVKPPEGVEIATAFDRCRQKGLPAGFIELMQQQKAFDDARPMAERVGIGGEVQFLVITKETYTLSTCHRFEDYEKDLADLFERTRDPEV